ncbi:peroxiredoxin-like family protein [Pseudomonas sp. RC10]|uniref:peroxiredoxin-like family protein n=1 Tax=Pseudomonas bambusae TaxID=3139142 RepID=UPI00313869D9
MNPLRRKPKMSLQAKLDAVRQDFESKIPSNALAVMHASTDALIASGHARRALQTGDHAPEFALPDSEGTVFTSHDLRLKGPIVITFYRGVWCPYCNLELQALEGMRTDIQARGATLIAISQQTPGNSRASRRDNALGFPILIDKCGVVAAEFGIRWTLEGSIRTLYEQFGVNLETFNGEPSWTLPIPGRYIIDTRGVIAYAEINPDYTRRPEPEELLPVLDALLENAGVYRETENAL